MNKYIGNILEIDVLQEGLLVFSPESSTDEYSMFEGKYKGNSIVAYSFATPDTLSDYIKTTPISLYEGLYNSGIIDQPSVPLNIDFSFANIMIYTDSEIDREIPGAMVNLNIQYFYCLEDALPSITVPINGMDYTVKKIEPAMELPPNAVLIKENDIPLSLNSIFFGEKECYYILSVIKPKVLVDTWIDETGKLTQLGEDELGKMCEANELVLVYGIITPYGHYVMAPNYSHEVGATVDVFDDELFTIINISAMLIS
jgi:hypothetical protein